ncbi:histone-lysine N-methyltransferase 2D isoform X3 [Toxorhynchites rutilus septentrionalis]|uniref:histone-lysine N-methyltransferase 2D isoform X3 n=1 Tax=Toxorhynchites rutilus septentrionalis TaxID=329112 RepID=UPI00247B2874|nr:histone-lysine N-methyltransferase 2D isoform X3 [Toxorhynchites rutilus septentrionalis]
MAATMRSRGLHHASSLGNIEASSSQSNTNLAARSYDSEDENMGRKKGRPFDTGSGLRAPVYSKGDIREQYCLTDRQLSSIEQPRRERFFGCWSGRNAPQSFLGVCVGRRAPSDENLADYAPMQRYPRYIHPGPISKSILQQYDDELDNPYFRRKPTSFLAGSGGSSGGGGIGGPMVTGSSATLPSGETRRCTWMPMDDEAVRMEGPSYSLCPLAISVPTFLSSRPRVNCQPQRCPAASDELEHSSWNRASSPFVIGTPVACSSGKAAAYLSRSTDQLTGMYRCPAHTDLPPPPPPPNVSLIDGVAGGPPRTKHVSFARSYTLTSFDEAMGGRPLSRLAAARSQERLIGGKKPTITLSQQQATTQFGTPLHSILQQPSHQPLLAQQLQQHQQQQQQQQLGGQPQPPSVHQHIHTHQHLQHIQQSHPGQLIAQHHHQHQHHHVLPQQQQQQQLQQQHQPQQKQQQQQLQAAPCSNAALAAPPPTVAAPTGSQQEVFVVEKIKRSAMKTQATQTEVYLNKKAPAPHQLSLSPRTIHRVKMVSQGAQTNGGLNGRKLTKSLSEAGDRIQENGIDSGAALDEPKTPTEHEQLHRTQSEEPPKSPFTITSPPSKSPIMQPFELPSRTSSQMSHTSHSDSYPIDTIMTHSRNHSQDSATSYRSTAGSRTSYETSSYPYEMYDSVVIPRRASYTLSTEPLQVLRKDIEQVHYHGHENGFVFETHSLPRRTCIHHKPEEFHTHTLPRRDHHPHHHHEIIFKDQLKMPPQEVLISNGIVNQDIRSFDSNSLNRRMSAHVSMHQDKQLQQRRASYAYVAPETHSLTRKNSITHQQIQKVQPMIQTPSYQQQKQPMSQSHQQPQPLSQQISAQQQQFQPLIKPQSPILSQPSHPPPSCPITPPNIQPLDMQDDTKSSSDESCSTCDSESDREDEKEIFIDFKPRVSPIPSPNAVKKKKLLKTLSDGEILLDRKKSKTPDAPTTISASEEDLKSPALENIQKDPPTNLQFSETPIKDEGIFFGSPLTEADRRKESFRKRSVSLDNPTSMEEEEKGLLEELKADAKDDKLTSPPSPSKEEKLSIKSHSPFHSSESLATRDNSDGIWNESQATIMTTSLTDNGKLTPSSRRKNLLLQHQQRSSMDTDALDIEDIADQPLPPLPVNVVPATMQSICTTTPTTPGSQSFPLPVTCMTIPIASSPSTATGVATAPTTTTTTTTTATPTITTGIVKPTPSIAVIPSPSIEREERDLQQRPMQKSATLRRLSRPPSPSKRRASDQRKLSKIEPLIHRSPDTNERNVPTLKDQSPISAPTVPPLPVTPAMPPPKLSSSTPTHPLPALSSTVNSGSGSRIPPAVPSARFEHAKLKGFEEKDLFGDGGAGSEGSTTEDYATCTDNSKRTGSTPPVGAKANAVQEGSSFESASSLYSLARVDAICEDTPPVEENTATPQIPPLPKPSPAHSLSSSSSGSYNMATKTRRSSPSRTVVPKPLPAKVKIKPESISDDERSEKRYSSSHDEKDIRGTLTRPARKGRDWNEEERRRKKSAFKLEFDKDSLKTYTTPMLRQPSPGFKKLSPEDKSALNVLDGASPSSKQKRFRPKTRKSPRTRTATSDDVTSTPMRRSKTPLIKSPEKPAIHTPTPIPKLSPVQYYSQIKSPPNQESPKKQKISPEQRLKAISTESLRSVSPGSDSVFYSEADALSQCEQQVHCHHCGKEVEAISIPGELEGSLATLSLDSTDADRPDIVQPPEGFADSPQCTKTTHRLYKKMDKRFRSEDRHADRRHFKSRQEYRAKSEERGKDDSEQSNLRSAGSSPCVAPVAPYGEHQAEPEQGIYRGNYRAGTWICIADRDAFRRYDLSSDGSFERPTRTVAERRGSTDSEKDFYKRYQAISHRLVHRRSCVELYRRQNTTNFEPDKIVVVSRKSGEFGFRIHGSRPVVVSAIEPDTPAETSGLEVGDIVLSVNGISVIDKSHSEVVKVAHAGSDTLELKIVRTIGVHSPLEDNTPVVAIYAGFLWRHSNSSSKKWVRRWFSLRPDHCLYYFKSELDIHPIGVVILTNHKVERLSAEVGGRPFSFTIDTGENTKVQLAGDNDEAASRWIAVISHAAQQGDPWLDNSARNLRIPASCVPKPDCVGPLTKLGSKWRSWTKRYCVLKDAVLYFYHEASSKSAFGMACLQGYRIQPSSAGGKKYAFEIVPPELTLRHYYFHTDTEMDKRRWVTALEYSIDRWMKAG